MFGCIYTIAAILAIPIFEKHRHPDTAQASAVFEMDHRIPWSVDIPWWRHAIETLSTLLATDEGIHHSEESTSHRYKLCRLQSVQMIDYIMIRRSYSFVCTLYTLMCAINRIYNELSAVFVSGMLLPLRRWAVKDLELIDVRWVYSVESVSKI